MGIQNKVFEAALAGLLHDIGKFAQRAGEQVLAEWSEGKTKSDFGYQHALHTWHFANKYLPASLKENVRMMAAYHHHPKDRGVVVQIADHLSAGERRKDELVRDDSDLSSHPKQLQPIFGTVMTKSTDTDGKQILERCQETMYFGLSQLRLERNVVFPAKEQLDEKKGIWEKYKSLWDEFCVEATQLKRDFDQSHNLEVYLEGMLSLFQRYTWCIPSAYFDVIPDVSLYDHSRMTAALAAVMSDENAFPADRLKRLDQVPEADEEEIALLVGGDISGVQDFIYTISSKGAAKMLRGRSFYLQLLTEAVLRFVLRHLGLPYTNVIYSGGGHFYLLAPLSAKDQLPQIQAEVGKILLQQHGTQLYLVIGYSPIPVKGFQLGHLREYWQKMHNALTLAKARRYAELQDELHALLFRVPEYGGNPDDTCSVCGDDRRGASNWDEWEAQSKICSLCRSFAEQIGKGLPTAQFLALKFGVPQSSVAEAKTALGILESFGMQVQFLHSADDHIEEDDPIEKSQKQHLVIWALDDPPNDKWPQTPQPAARWLRYTVKHMPIVRDRAEADVINRRLGNRKQEEKARVGQPMTFSHLNVLVEGGFERLGVLRMDVDNLGDVFSTGLGTSFSLSRMATLSFQISLFFEGWLKRIVEEKAWENRVYAVYSGGDDLFLLAPWDKVPALAQEIADNFTAYTCQHPGLHISGGMAFIDGKYPIYQAAEDAGDAEEIAKKDDKNAFCFLGRRWGWHEFRHLAAYKDELEELIQGEATGERAGPKSILQVLRLLARMEEEEASRRKRPVWGRWMWLGAYLLVRIEERNKNNPKLRAKIADVRQKLGNFQNINIWGAAARWAQLETRKRSNSGQG